MIAAPDRLLCICGHAVERHHFSSTESDALPCLDCGCWSYLMERRYFQLPVAIERRGR